MAFKPGQSGNPAGRPVGSNPTRTMYSRMIQESAGRIIPRLIELALQGEMVAMKLCVERIVPRIKENSMSFNLPSLTDKTPEQLTHDLFQAMSGQEVTAEEIRCVLDIIRANRTEDNSKDLKEVAERSREILEELRKANEKDF